MHKHLFSLLGVVFALTVSGCGGGGNGDSPPPTPTTQAPITPNLTIAVQTAFTNFVNTGIDLPFTISGSVDQSTGVNPRPPTPITGSGRETIGPGMAGTFTGGPFDGFSVFRVTEVVSGMKVMDGQSTPIGSAGQVYYHATNYTILVTDFPGEYTVYDAHTYPEMVKAGDTGFLRSGRQYQSFADSLTPETPFFHPIAITVNYVVSSDSATTLLVRFIEDSNDQILGHVGQTQSVYRIDTVGNVSPVSVTTLKYLLGSVYQTIVFTF